MARSIDLIAKKGLIPTAALSVAAAFLLSSCAVQTTEAAGPPAESGKSSSMFGKFFGPRIVTIPAGTVLRVRTDSSLSTTSTQTGDRFEGTLFAPVAKDGRTLLPVGTQVEGVIASSGKGGRVKGVASMTLRLTGIHRGPKNIDVETTTVTFSARTTKRRDAATIGIGSGVGAAIGALAGGGTGAAIGALAGGGAGTGVVLGTRGQQLNLAPETPLRFTTKTPIEIPVS